MAGSRVLILGGTAEAVSLAGQLAAIPGLAVVTSLAGVTRSPHMPPGTVRIGGFGGAEGLAWYLEAENITALVDATHPHAAQISAHAAAACAATGVPTLHLTRPMWSPEPGDDWHFVEDATAAAGWLRQAGLPDGAVIFLTIGRAEVGAFAEVGRFRYLVRSIEAPADLHRLGEVALLRARGPFTVEDERSLMEDHAVACLVAKNSGGTSSHAKIVAARTLGLPVLMLQTPPPPSGETVETVDAAVMWLRAILDNGKSTGAPPSETH